MVPEPPPRTAAPHTPLPLLCRCFVSRFCVWLLCWLERVCILRAGLPRQVRRERTHRGSCPLRWVTRVGGPGAAVRHSPRVSVRQFPRAAFSVPFPDSEGQGSDRKVRWQRGSDGSVGCTHAEPHGEPGFPNCQEGEAWKTGLSAGFQCPKWGKRVKDPEASAMSVLVAALSFCGRGRREGLERGQWTRAGPVPVQVHTHAHTHARHGSPRTHAGRLS